MVGRKARDRVSPAPNASPETADRWLGRGLAPRSVRFSHGRLPVFQTSRCRLFRISQAIAASEMVRSAAAAGLLALLSDRRVPRVGQKPAAGLCRTACCLVSILSLGRRGPHGNAAARTRVSLSVAIIKLHRNYLSWRGLCFSDFSAPCLK